MIFSSLKNVLLSERSAQKTVSFSHEKTLCWSQFLADIKALTIKLNDFHKPRLAICCDDSYLFCVAFFAAVYADKKIVLPGNYQPAMLLSLSDHFDAIIHDGLVADDFTKEQLILPLTDKQQLTDFKFCELDLAKIEITLFTSGSSGLPKAINKSLLMLDTEIVQLEALWGDLLGDSNIVSTVSHQHIYGLLFRVLWPLCAGRSFARNDLVYPEQILTSANNSCTLISSPALLKRLPEDSHGASYAAVFSSGGPLNRASAKQCNTLFNHYPFEVFGSTETGGIGYRQQSHAAMPWTFFSGIFSQLAEDNCLSLRSPWIDEKSWYQTSDQCDLLENNQFILKGRVDRIVKIEEKRISLVEVEQRLNQLEWIDESAVLLFDETHRLTLGAVITLSEQGKKSMQAVGKGKFWIKLRQALRLWLEPVGIPRHYRVVSELPVNTQGKLLHSEIAQLFKKQKVSKKSGADNVTT
ncbi:MAG: acyl-coenzyme A synthetase/AMP-(fatty) acid ligase [Psychromonas sp.]|jgi:acyl-coenzyme A synthetase/AMP-(fatty) acid ligase|uniref:AMP-binding protein n=1 Tax=Psychromonas sp. TaxID=1884585 RepID=UPI0039E65C86